MALSSFLNVIDLKKVEATYEDLFSRCAPPPSRGGRHGDAGLRIGRQGMQEIEDFVDHAIDEDKPFFIWYAPFLPHTPHNPPDRLLERYAEEGRPADVARYYAMCEWFDETCGQLVNIIDERELTENTIFLYVCDNGWTARGASDHPRQEVCPMA